MRHFNFPFTLTSLFSASKKDKPEWPVIWQINRRYKDVNMWL
jgi:hypothetical protein